MKSTRYLLIIATVCACACTRSGPGDQAVFDAPDAAGSSPFVGVDAADVGASRNTSDTAPGSESDADQGSEKPDISGNSPDSTDAFAGEPVCSPGAQKCEGPMLATCSPALDGWTVAPCFPGHYCRNGACQKIENNLVIAFDTSGSMSVPVKGKTCGSQVFPNCKPASSCTRMAVSKMTFGKALEGVDLKTTRLALFRFPQRLASTTSTSCNKGFYAGMTKLSGDLLNEQSVDAKSTWFWSGLHQIMSVPFPTTEALAAGQKKQIARWMDGSEKLQKTGKSCANANKFCASDAACGGGACCGGQCYVHAEPELRANGGTPIGKTLFYVGEYFRNRIVIDGKACIVHADCNNPNYRCEQGFCRDAAADCRENILVLFTDGGENNDPTSYFAPQVSAKRLRYGLACKTIDDCAGDARCKNGKCLPEGGTGHHCVATSSPCKPGITDKSHIHYCPPIVGKPQGECLPDSLAAVSAEAKFAAHNVLRSASGKPFSVRVHVVDISGNTSLTKSFTIAMAGGGRLLTADAADANAFLNALSSALDMKNEKVCGTKSGP